MKSERISEAVIQKSILEYLAAEHIFAIRMNSGTQIGSYKGKKWAIHMNAAGTADILAFLPSTMVAQRADGRFTYRLQSVVWLEVKAADGKQSELQASFQAQVEREGHCYAVVRSIDDVKELLGY